MTLEMFFRDNPELAVALSGGVDSAYLLYAASRLAKRVQAYCAVSPFQPRFETDTARQLAQLTGVKLRLIPLDVLSSPAVRANDPRRCYYCKKEIFGHIVRLAAGDGFSLVADGTNASDAEDDRPGMQALRELGVRSPLRECGLKKAEIRSLAREAGLPVWDRPSYACLATRIPAGQAITPEALEKIEAAEDGLFRLGYTDFRVRLRGDTALVQITAGQQDRAREQWGTIEALLSEFFPGVRLDSKPRSKSL